MLQKLTYVSVSDRTGLGWLQTIHLYRGFYRRYTYIGEYIKASIKTILHYPKRRRGRRYKRMRVGFVVRGLFVHARWNKSFFDCSRLLLLSNKIITLKRKGTFKSKYTFGPIIRNIRRYQYYNLFSTFI
jgi:ribosomal protein L14